MFKNHSFHEAEVINYYIQDNNIYLDLEDVTNNDDKKVNGTFIFESIQDVEIDDIKSNDIRMYYADGEIIDLAQHGDSIMLIIRWFNYEPHDAKTISYLINCKSSEWTITE